MNFSMTGECKCKRWRVCVALGGSWHSASFTERQQEQCVDCGESETTHQSKRGGRHAAPVLWDQARLRVQGCWIWFFQEKPETQIFIWNPPPLNISNWFGEEILINLHEPSKTYLPFTFEASDLLRFLLILFVAFCKEESGGLTGISVDFGLCEELCVLRFPQVSADGQIHARWVWMWLWQTCWLGF